MSRRNPKPYFLPIHKSLLSLACALSTLLWPATLKRWTGGFHLKNISTEYLSTDFHADVPPPSSEVMSLLHQPFFYLAHGAQSYVFRSQDGCWILKLLRTYPQESWFQSRWRPLFHRTTRHPSSQAEKQYKSLEAAQIAFDRARDITGLLYVHLACTDRLLPSLQIDDHLQRKRSIALDDYLFILQAKAQPMYEALHTTRMTHDRTRLCQQIKAILTLFHIRQARGITNADRHSEIGFLGDTAIEIDCASYTLKQEMPEEIAYRTRSLYQWLSCHVPELWEEIRFEFEEKEPSL